MTDKQTEDEMGVQRQKVLTLVDQLKIALNRAEKAEADRDRYRHDLETARAEIRALQLEQVLDSEEDVPIEILPNGEVRVKGSVEPSKGRKPLTMREDLGGEYCDE